MSLTACAGRNFVDPRVTGPTNNPSGFKGLTEHIQMIFNKEGEFCVHVHPMRDNTKKYDFDGQGPILSQDPSGLATYDFVLSGTQTSPVNEDSMKTLITFNSFAKSGLYEKEEQVSIEACDYALSLSFSTMNLEPGSLFSVLYRGIGFGANKYNGAITVTAQIRGVNLNLDVVVAQAIAWLDGSDLYLSFGDLIDSKILAVTLQTTRRVPMDLAQKTAIRFISNCMIANLVGYQHECGSVVTTAAYFKKKGMTPHQAYKERLRKVVERVRQAKISTRGGGRHEVKKACSLKVGARFFAPFIKGEVKFTKEAKPMLAGFIRELGNCPEIRRVEVKGLRCITGGSHQLMMDRAIVVAQNITRNLPGISANIRATKTNELYKRGEKLVREHKCVSLEECPYLVGAEIVVR